MQWDWEGFLGRPEIAPDKALTEAAVQSKCLLITGAGGSIGSRVALDCLDGRPKTLLLLDSSEHSLYEIYKRIVAQTTNASTQIVPIVGNFADRPLLDLLFRQHHPDMIFHTAAYKHVPLMEQNPFRAMANNALGTFKLVLSALENGSCDILLVSTDKAVNPTSIMGASKRAAELIVLSHSCSAVRMNAVRLGNVLGSSGSVVPLFREQLEASRPLTVTHPDARRYFLTSAEAGSAVLRAANCFLTGRILLADFGISLSILELARHMADLYLISEGLDRRTRPAIEFIGLRPGEKLEESPYSTLEHMEQSMVSGMRVVKSPCPAAGDVAAGMERIEAAIQSLDLREMLAATTHLVADYQPAFSLRSDSVPVAAR
jgi:FlaA1/EpsC-like NDP-sugar epimerase